jgi:hypothetical protein
MASRYIFLILSIIFLSNSVLNGQEKIKVKYGDIKPEDFVKNYSIDSSAEAVVIYDKGIITINGAIKGGFQMEFERHRRVHILNKSGFDHGKLEELLYIAGLDQEKMVGLEGTTYNLVNGKVVKSESKSENEFKVQVNRYYDKKSIILPNVREGSIVEFKYKITSPYIYNLRQWDFQEDIPVLYSELNTYLPHFYIYTKSIQGTNPLYIQSSEEKMLSLRYNDIDNAIDASQWVTTTVKTYFNVYAAKDQQAIRKEPFSSSINNFLGKINFQLSAITSPLRPRQITNDWKKLNEEFYTDAEYQDMFDDGNGKIKELIQTIGILDNDNDKVKIKKAVEYVRQNFKHNGLHGIYLSNKVSKILENKTGSSEEINALLVKILNTANVKTFPLILSTRENGYVNEFYPFKEHFNRMIATTKVDGNRMFLDAADDKLPVGSLAPSFNNGYARIINEFGEATSIAADSVKEKNLFSVKISAKENKLIGKVENKYAILDGYSQRKNSSEEAILAAVKSKLSADMILGNSSFPNFGKVDEPLNHTFDFSIDLPAEDSFIYIDPFIFSSYRDNPFPSGKRTLPIELSHLEEDTYLFSLDIPAGYTAVETPKPVLVSVDEVGTISLEYRTTVKPNNISIRSKIKINKARFEPDSYNLIQEQFNRMSKKLNEQIVLKKL